jgi:hypothetical protein
MYWYNPATRTSERVTAPSIDEEAIQMLAGDSDSVAFVTEYAELRHSGMEIETALILVGHEFRLRQHEHSTFLGGRHGTTVQPDLGHVLAGTSSFWHCAFERNAGTDGQGTAPKQGHDGEQHIGTSENTSSRHSGE